LTAFAFFLASCYGASRGENDGVGGPLDSGPISQDDFPEAFADARCTSVKDCCESEGLTYDLSSCRDRSVSMATMDAPWDGVEWDPYAARACVDEFSRAGSECVAVNILTSACNRLVRGTVPEGEPCEGSVECATSDGLMAECLVNSLSGGIGTCALLALPRLGESCSFDCELGAYCDYAQSRTCVQTKPAGDACSAQNECASGSCVGGVCEVPPPVNTLTCSGR
jgi:hypothetical protein